MNVTNDRFFKELENLLGQNCALEQDQRKRENILSRYSLAKESDKYETLLKYAKILDRCRAAIKQSPEDAALIQNSNEGHKRYFYELKEYALDYPKLLNGKFKETCLFKRDGETIFDDNAIEKITKLENLRQKPASVHYREKRDLVEKNEWHFKVKQLEEKVLISTHSNTGFVWIPKEKSRPADTEVRYVDIKESVDLDELKEEIRKKIVAKEGIASLSFAWRGLSTGDAEGLLRAQPPRFRTLPKHWLLRYSISQNGYVIGSLSQNRIINTPILSLDQILEHMDNTNQAPIFEDN